MHVVSTFLEYLHEDLVKLLNENSTALTDEHIESTFAAVVTILQLQSRKIVHAGIFESSESRADILSKALKIVKLFYLNGTKNTTQVRLCKCYNQDLGACLFFFSMKWYIIYPRKQAMKLLP